MNWLSISAPLTPADLDQVERDLGISLPADYKAQIGPINGGALRNACVRVPELGEISYSRNVPLHPEAKAGIYDLVHIFNKESINLLPFASVGNGDYFCFSLTDHTVVLYLHETGTAIYVCDSFTQLLGKLVTE